MFECGIEKKSKVGTKKYTNNISSKLRSNKHKSKSILKEFNVRELSLTKIVFDPHSSRTRSLHKSICGEVDSSIQGKIMKFHKVK